MNVAGRLEIMVAGEQWTPVTTLADCGPEDPCYVVHVDDDGAATLVFGDGTTGRRPPVGALIEATYRRGGGETGHVGNGRSSDSVVALLELWAQMADLLSRYQDQIASEAYLEADRERTSLDDAADLQRAITGRHVEIRVCICLRPVSRREDQIKE